MELKHYLLVIRKRWWLAAIAAVVTVAVTLVYTAQQPWIYESEATFVVRPRLLDGADVVKATDTLIRGPEIRSTFANIGRSEYINDRAKAILGKDVTRGQALNVTTDVVAGTNILKIRVSGRDPDVVLEYSKAVAAETVSYIDGLDDVFTLAPLDEPRLPTSPAGPQKAATNMFGVIVGLSLGAFLAFGAEYLSEPTPDVGSFDVIDPESGAYNEAYFRDRFDQEMSRAQHTGQPFTLVMIQTTRGALARGNELMTTAEIADAIAPMTRQEDVLAHVGDGTFALILAGMHEHEAERVLADWATAHWPDSDGVPPADSPFNISVGVCEYGSDLPAGRIRAV